MIAYSAKSLWELGFLGPKAVFLLGNIDGFSVLQNPSFYVSRFDLEPSLRFLITHAYLKKEALSYENR